MLTLNKVAVPTLPLHLVFCEGAIKRAILVVGTF